MNDIIKNKIQHITKTSDSQVKIDDIETLRSINEIKRNLGDKLLILTHHYQRREIVEVGDYRGDSFALSKKAAENQKAEYIVFCGVHFMAESAAILARPDQVVQIPNMEAGCWMADMISIEQVEMAWDALESITGQNVILPVVYVNSDAEIKAFCGRHGGLTCTSSNAHRAIEKGFKKYEKILFLPDQHLGRNTGNQLGIFPDEMIVWNPDKPLGGNTPESIEKSKLILWDGFCLVHTRFKTNQIITAREKHPDAKIVVHPECTQEVVAQADAVGSTSFIVKYVEDAPSGSTIVIGTEINLIERLSAEHPDKKVIPLSRSLCPNMSKINLDNLKYVLENIGQVNIVEVPDNIIQDARLALKRMLLL